MASLLYYSAGAAAGVVEGCLYVASLQLKWLWGTSPALQVRYTSRSTLACTHLLTHLLVQVCQECSVHHVTSFVSQLPHSYKYGNQHHAPTLPHTIYALHGHCFANWPHQAKVSLEAALEESEQQLGAVPAEKQEAQAEAAHPRSELHGGLVEVAGLKARLNR